MSKTTLIQVTVDDKNNKFIKQVDPIAMLNGFKSKPQRVNFCLTILRELHEQGKFDLKDFIK